MDATGATPKQIARFLDAEPLIGDGTIRDQMAARMANQLLAALGRSTDQSGAKAKRLREQGTWRAYDHPPSSG